jgi:hypothetical protein
MSESLKNEDEDYCFAILDIQRGKLHERKIDASIQPLLEGEAKSFATIWSRL